MDTPSWPTTSLPPLVAMVLQEPSRVDLLAALSEDEASGSAQWPLARSRIGCPSAGMRNIVVMSNDTSTGAVSTKKAATGRVGSGVRQK